jgi:hypothetical protein
MKNWYLIQTKPKQDSQTVSSSFIGAKYKDLKVGLATNPGEDSNSAEIAYDYKF